MGDRRRRDSAWGQTPAAATAFPRPSGDGDVPAAAPITSSGPEIAKSEPSIAAPSPAIDAGDGWGRPPAPVGTSQRDNRGRFLPGNSGNGGRPKGARNRLTSLVLTALVEDFAEHGAGAVAALREKDPAAYLDTVINLIPRPLILQHETEPDYSDLNWEEIAELIERTEQNEQVKIALEEVRKLGRLPHHISPKPKD